MPPPFTRRTALALFTVSIATAGATVGARAAEISPDDQALVDRAIAYLDGLASVKGRFVQTGQKGDVATGELWLARPGRARFDYDPPSSLLITSDGKTVTISNGRLKTVQRFPLSSTPLAIFLAEHIRLDRGAQVMRVDRTADGFSITAHDSRGPAEGWITLYFDDHPMRLIGWAITDAQRRVTRVSLQDLTPAAEPPAAFFTQTASGPEM